MSFPRGFVWGAATSAHQIEGFPQADGGGLSIWDIHERTPGRVYGGHHARTACEHYRRYREDVRIMSEIGLQSYRFSTSWARVVSEGGVNEKGLDFYDRLVDELLSRSIRPLLTLYHWELPYHLFLRGGWLNPEVSNWFGEYVCAVARRLGDRVVDWVTLNEPQCFVGGYANGDHAPGTELGVPYIIHAVHNGVLAHHRAVALLRSECGTPPRVAPAPVAIVSMPGDSLPGSEEAARAAMWRAEPEVTSTRLLYWNNRIWMDALLRGAYPESVLGQFESVLGEASLSGLAGSREESDFLACNIYNGTYLSGDGAGRVEEVEPYPGYPRTGFNWPVTPEALYWGPRFLYERYRLPITISENGLSSKDVVSLEGGVEDPGRIDFMRRYLIELRRAIDEGVDVRSYYYWSLMDNFEWSFGYRERFGLVHVNFQDQTRIVKRSGRWYRGVIETNGAEL